MISGFKIENKNAEKYVDYIILSILILNLKVNFYFKITFIVKKNFSCFIIKSAKIFDISIFKTL